MILGTKAIDVGCPTCRAEPGEVCDAVAPIGGVIVGGCHRARVLAAMKITRDGNAAARRSETSA